MSKGQFKGIHDEVNDQGFAMHYRRLTSFLMLSVLEAKIFQYVFLEEHKVYLNDHY